MLLTDRDLLMPRGVWPLFDRRWPSSDMLEMVDVAVQGLQRDDIRTLAHGP